MPRRLKSRLQMRRPAVESQFVNFLIAQGNPEAVTTAAMHLLEATDKGTTGTLLELATGSSSTSVPIWP